MELISLNLSTIKKLNSFQNYLIRYLFKLPTFSHMTNFLCALNIFDFRILQYKFKLSFLKRVNDHPLTKQIFESLYLNFNLNTKSSSFLKNIYDIMEILNCNLDTLLTKNCLIILKNYVLNINNEYKQGIVDSLKTCLSNYKDLFYQDIFGKLLIIKF